MKKLGIVGGLAWPSTIDYYRALCRMAVARHAGEGPASTPEMCIESLDVAKSFGMIGKAGDEASWASYDRYFRQALERLEAAGAEVAIIAANTPHNRFDAITRGMRLPVVSIFEAVARECARLGVREMLVLGTALTMQSPVFPAVLARFGVRGFAPASAEERAKVLGIIAELYAERAVNAAARIREVVDRVMPAAGGERAVCLGCTELPLAFPAIEREPSLAVGDVRYFNSTIIHAREAFAALEG